VRLVGEEEPGLLPAVVNLGCRPTFAEAGESVEVHLLDWEGDLYGRELEVFFLQRQRAEMSFPDGEALRLQIAEDVAEARVITAAAAQEWRIPGEFLPIEGTRAEDLG